MRWVDLFGIVLLLGAITAFTAGALALADRQDLVSLYWLVVGALALRASTLLFRPRAGPR